MTQTPCCERSECFEHGHALILAGGSGTRLWPLSRTLLPKQLLALDGDKSLLQQTLDRVLRFFSPEKVWVVTNEEHLFEVRSQMKAIRGGLQEQALAEPLARNTLAAILLGLDRIESVDPGAQVAVFPSDHQIEGEDAFGRSLAKAFGMAGRGLITTFGIKPTKPETGYGYIHLGPSFGDDCYAVQGFAEKPDLKTAQEYLASGDYLWNSGMFVFETQSFLDGVAKHAPEHYSWWQSRKEQPLTQGYAGLPDLSVDYGVIERADNLGAVAASFGWDDLGNWEAVYRLGTKDDSGCVVQGDVLNLDCGDSLLVSRGGGKLAAIGLKDLIVIQTADATLICPMQDVQRVKEVVNTLKKQESPLVETHVTVRRPWGSYTVLEEGPNFKIKRIEVLPGSWLSLQMHHHRDEHWVVIAGTAEVTVGEDVMLLGENESVDIPKTFTHRLGNPGKVPVEIIEVQTGPYLEEDDIVRFDDVYGRKTPVKKA